MRKVIAAAMVVVVLVGSGIAAAGGAHEFKDVHGVLAPQIARAHAEGLVNGYSDGTFKPDRPITRAEFVKLVVVMIEKVLGRLLPAPEGSGELFRDVSRDHPHYRYLHKARRAGYIFEGPDGRFGPDRPIRRADAAGILGSALPHVRPEGARAVRFRDVDPSDPVVQPIVRLAVAGIFKGFTDGYFRPDAFLTRAQAAAVVVRAYDVRRANPPALGTWENPVPLGREFALKSWWRLTVVEITDDAWPVIRAASPDNKPPVPGRQYVMARVRLTYVGDRAGNPRSPLDLAVDYEGYDGLAYGRWEPEGRGMCGVVPDALPWHQALKAGDTVEGNICWSVPKAVIKGGLITVFDAGAEHFMGPVSAFFMGVPR